MDLPYDLREALEQSLGGLPVSQVSAGVERLIRRYRQEQEARAPILTSVVDVTAYALYRMPATYAAVLAALRQLRSVAPDFAPVNQVDVGGGTGAAAWAAAEAFPGLASITVLDQVQQALDLGERLAAGAELPVVRQSLWQRSELDRLTAFPQGDLVTVSYLLSELSPADQQAVVGKAAAGAGSNGAVVIVEPGTPGGFRRILVARSELIGLGLSIAAPCPHQGQCPIAAAGDWCHFAARINRTALHRRIKGGELSYEDEKFSYVVASRTPLGRAPGRVLRHPLRRKGLVSMSICQASGRTQQLVVSKRQGETYREAKQAGWGDPWPPPERSA